MPKRWEAWESWAVDMWELEQEDSPRSRRAKKQVVQGQDGLKSESRVKRGSASDCTLKQGTSI